MPRRYNNQFLNNQRLLRFFNVLRRNKYGLQSRMLVNLGDSGEQFFATFNGIFFVYFCIFFGPVNISINLFTIAILMRKELRSTYNFVFILMALDQSIVIGTISISMYRFYIFNGCTPENYTLFASLYDMVSQQLTAICKGHATWLAVIIAFMRLKSIRTHGAAELPFNHVVLLCGGAMLFVVVANIPNLFGVELVWIRLDEFCEPEDSKFGDVVVPVAIDSPALYTNDCLLLRVASLLTGSLHSALPCLLLIVLSTMLLRTLYQARKEREVMVLHKSTRGSNDGDRTTTLLIFIMISTMISEIPQAIMSIFDGLLSSRMRTNITSKIATFVLSFVLITSACNLFIYLSMSKKFRKLAKGFVCFPFRKFRKIASRQSSSS